MGSLWLFYTFFPGSYWRIGEVYWWRALGNGSNRDHTWIAVSVSNLPGNLKSIKEEKSWRNCLLVWILCPEYRLIWKAWAGTWERCSEKAGKNYCGGIYPEYPDRQRRKLYYDHCTKQTRKWEDLYYSYLPQLRCKESGNKRSSEHLWILRTASYPMTKDTFRICPVKDKIFVQYAQCIKRIFYKQNYISCI